MASEPISERTYVAAAVADLGDRHARPLSEQLHALETIMRFEPNGELRIIARRRYLDLTDKERAA